MLRYRLLILALFLGNMEVSSQITLYQSDYASIGDTIISANDTIAPVSVAIGGTGAQSWNFTGLQNLFTDTVFYSNPQNTPYTGSFPNSNLAAEDTSLIIYTSVTSQRVSIDGYAGMDPFGAGTTVETKFFPSQKILSFPISNGSMFLDTAGSVSTIETSSLGLPVPNLDSMRLVHTSYVSSIIDAYGTVDIAGGSYNSIRQLYSELIVDSSFAYCSDPAGCNMFITTLPFGWSFLPSQLTELMLGSANPELDTSNVYRWWAKGTDQPIVELTMDALMTQIIRSRYKIGVPPTAIVASLSNVSCTGACNGSAKVIGIDGNSPYSYLWDDPSAQTDSVANGLCPGIFNVRVINALSDTVFVSLTIGSPDSLMATLSSTIDSGGPSGTASASIMGGTAPYSYAWNTSPSQTTQTATGLSLGMYAVVITDASGCVYSDSVIVLNLGCSVSASFTLTTSSVCEGEPISFTNMSIGNVTNNWQIDSTSFANTLDASYLFDSAGIYTVTLIVANGSCGDTISQNITINSSPAIPTVTVLGNAFSCDFSSATYQWFFNSDTIVGATNQVYLGTATGFYMVTVIDVNGCSSTSANFGYTTVESILSNSEIAVYPNPSTGHFVIDLVSVGNGQIIIQMENYLGQLVYRKSLDYTENQNAINIDVSFLRPGMYTMEIIVADKRVVRKIVLQ